MTTEHATAERNFSKILSSLLTARKETISLSRVSDCPKRRLDPKHYIGFKRCGCFKAEK